MADHAEPVNPGLRIHMDSEASPKQKLEDVNGWYRSSIRAGVATFSLAGETDEFKEWKTRCIGRVVLQPEPVDTEGNYTKIPRWYVYLEKQEDLVSYLLTFDEITKQPDKDSAFYYAPYIPLTFSGINSPNTAPAGSVFFDTRYGTVTVFKDDVDTQP